jgi:hypothetical protein
MAIFCRQRPRILETECAVDQHLAIAHEIVNVHRGKAAARALPIQLTSNGNRRGEGSQPPHQRRGKRLPPRDIAHRSAREQERQRIGRRQHLYGDGAEQVGIVNDASDAGSVGGAEAGRREEVRHQDVGTICRDRPHEPVVHRGPERPERIDEAPRAADEARIERGSRLGRPQPIGGRADRAEIDERHRRRLGPDLRFDLARAGKGNPPPAPVELLGLPEQRIDVADERNGGEERVHLPHGTSCRVRGHSPQDAG